MKILINYEIEQILKKKMLTKKVALISNNYKKIKLKIQSHKNLKKLIYKLRKEFEIFFQYLLNRKQNINLDNWTKLKYYKIKFINF